MYDYFQNDNKSAFSHFTFYLILQFSEAQQVEVDTTMWVTDSPVDDIVRSGNTIYLVGQFTHVGPNTGSGAILNQNDGKLAKAPFLQITGIVRVAVSDNKGGWFIGGESTSVQGVVRNRLAYILANGTLDQLWDPKVDGYFVSAFLSHRRCFLRPPSQMLQQQYKSNLSE